MRPAQCFYSTQRALYRVFVRPSPAVQLLPPLASIGRLPSRRSYIRPKKRDVKPTLSLAEQVAADEKRKHDPRYTTQMEVERSGRSRLPQDHEITDPHIMVHEGASLEGPLQTKFVLTRIEPHESLRMVAPYMPATADKPETFAVCRIVDKKAELEKAREQRALKQMQKQQATKEKEIEINWGISQNDLKTKFGMLARLMDGPAKVTVRLGKKKRSKTKVPEADMEALVKQVRKEAEDLGGRETSKTVGPVGLNMALTFLSKQARS